MKVFEMILVIVAIVGFITSSLMGGIYIKKKDPAYVCGYFACAIINFCVFLRLIFQ